MKLSGYRWTLNEMMMHGGIGGFVVGNVPHGDPQMPTVAILERPMEEFIPRKIRAIAPKPKAKLRRREV